MGQRKGAKRPVVVVLGMHRAGTSLTAGMLERLGVRLGDELIAGRPENPLGFFEHAGIVEQVKQIEVLLDRRPFRPTGLLPFPEGWLEREDVRAVRARLSEILAAEIQKAGTRPFGFKDPRTSRFLPLWQEIFAELDLTPRYVLALRRPQAVVQSNIARTHLSSDEAQLIWAWHYVDALRFTGGDIAAVVDYERWFSEPVGQAAEVAQALGLDFSADRVAEACSELVRGDLNHAASGGSSAEVKPFVAELHEALRHLRSDSGAAARAQELAGQFLRVTALVSPWALGCESQDSLLSHLVDASRHAGRLRERELRLAAELESLRGDLKEREREVKSLRREVKKLRKS